ncbi:MAG: FAD-dependent oxidoreductase [Bdellovibrionales bacterium]|nr:FAD-dependent oxidoreductase [Bdellovibrionales bacterium]
MSDSSVLLSPFRLGHLTLKNRSIMGSMHTGLEETWGRSKKISAFYAERAHGEAGLIITGGISPNFRGRLTPIASQLSFRFQLSHHRKITKAVHEAQGLICLQLLHAGRYAHHPWSVGPTDLKAPISKFKPKELTAKAVEQTIQDFVDSARLAQDAGYDGVEIMGSEGYLINQFIAQKTNLRTDAWGGSFQNRARFAIQIAEGTRRAVGPNFLIVFRISILDLVKDGSSLEEVIALAQALEQAGVTCLNSGIGWHESRVPTIAAVVPRGGYSRATSLLRPHIKIPLIACNRINTPATAEAILKSGVADLVSMARPWLADGHFIKKYREGREKQINVCIACNQACLDHIFEGKRASCLVNPRACFETERVLKPIQKKKNIAVVGSGPAGLSSALTLLERGHSVQLFEKQDVLGGQFRLARLIPEKEEFQETLNYFENEILRRGGKIHLGTAAQSEELRKFDEIVLATGVNPRKISIPGLTPENCTMYDEFILSKTPLKFQSYAVIGSGGIGIDVCRFILEGIHHGQAPKQDAVTRYDETWGVDINQRSGLAEGKGLSISAAATKNPQIYLLQRGTEKLGQKLGKTTSWIHRSYLKNAGVAHLSGVEYLDYSPRGLRIKNRGQETVLNVQHVVICAGQVSNTQLAEELTTKGISFHIIGGAKLAGDLDSKRAILEGFEVANQI